ncbi:MAG TPA: DUF192 domain-containing protein [Candidatus Polarisedimenticolia bacterium]|jgi:hypothetical protein
MNAWTGPATDATSETAAALDETTRTVVAGRVRRADGLAGLLAGLLGGGALAEDEGLFISPCRTAHTLGMRSAIDAVFLDAQLRVVKVRERMGPWRASRPVKEAASVLKLPAGSIRRTGIAVGNQLDFVPDC